MPEDIQKELGALAQFRDDVRRFIHRIEPLIDERSGLIATLETIRRDLDGAHQKLRDAAADRIRMEREARTGRERLREWTNTRLAELDERMDRMEKREARLMGWFSAIVAVVTIAGQFLLPLALAWAEAKLGL